MSDSKDPRYSKDERFEGDADSPLPKSSRLGLALFAVYLAFYGTFVLLAAFRPDVMESDVAAGINVAVAYGIGLIVMALVLALLYAWLSGMSPGERDTETKA